MKDGNTSRQHAGIYMNDGKNRIDNIKLYLLHQWPSLQWYQVPLGISSISSEKGKYSSQWKVRLKRFSQHSVNHPLILPQPHSQLIVF